MPNEQLLAMLKELLQSELKAATLEIQRTIDRIATRLEDGDKKFDAIQADILKNRGRLESLESYKHKAAAVAAVVALLGGALVSTGWQWIKDTGVKAWTAVRP